MFAALVGMLVGLLGLRAGRGSPDAIATAAVLAFLSGVTFTLFPAVLSPRPWRVAVVLFSLAVLIDVAQIANALRYPYQRYRVPLAAAMNGAEALGGVLALFLARRWASSRAAPVPGRIEAPGLDSF